MSIWANTVYALDATTIDLCLSVFPWAPFRSTKAAVRLHTLLDLRGNIPSFLDISDVIRAKSNLRFQRRYSRPSDPAIGIICDQLGVLTDFYSAKDYLTPLRRIRCKDELGKTLVFLTNNIELNAATISELYRCRWQVELFFKWIKQHLRIKAFFGTSENVVKTQI